MNIDLLSILLDIHVITLLRSIRGTVVWNTRETRNIYQCITNPSPSFSLILCNWTSIDTGCQLEKYKSTLIFFIGKEKCPEQKLLDPFTGLVSSAKTRGWQVEASTSLYAQPKFRSTPTSSFAKRHLSWIHRLRHKNRILPKDV